MPGITAGGAGIGANKRHPGDRTGGFKFLDKHTIGKADQSG